MRRAFPDDGAEVSEVIAAHLNDAYVAAGDDPDAENLRSQAKDAYVAAGDRAESVGAPEAAETAYLKAKELSADEAEQADLLEKAGNMASLVGADERTLGHYEAAIALHRSAGRLVDSARVTPKLAGALLTLGRVEESVDRLRSVLSSLDRSTAPPGVIASLEERLGRSLWYAGRPQDTAEPIEHALTLSQHYELGETYARALQIKGYLYASAGRVEEAILYMDASLEAARRCGATRVEMGTENLIADMCMIYDRPGAEEHCLAGLALARRRGARAAELNVTNNLLYVLTLAGRFDEAYRRADELLNVSSDESGHLDPFLHGRLAALDALRGNIESARSHLGWCREFGEGDDMQSVAMYATCEAAVALAEGDNVRAFDAASKAIEACVRDLRILAHESVRASFPDAVDAALALGDLEAVDRLVGDFTDRPPGEIPPFLRMQLIRAQALADAARGADTGVEERLLAAETTFRDFGYLYWQARLQLDLAEWLAGQGRRDEARKFADAAASTFGDLRVEPMLARARAVQALELSGR